MHDFSFKAIEFETAGDALQHTEAAGGKAILFNARNFVVTTDEAIRIERAGVEFAYVVEHEMPGGECQILTIPVN